MQPHFHVRRLVTGAALCACAAAAAAPAPAGAASGGGAMYLAKPKITKVKCVRRCASRKRARGGSTIRVTGSELGGVNTVTFHGTYGRGDDVTARVRGAGATQLRVRVRAASAVLIRGWPGRGGRRGSPPC